MRYRKNETYQLAYEVERREIEEEEKARKPGFFATVIAIIFGALLGFG